MADETIRVLLVEDDEEDYMIARDLLAEAKGQHFDLTWADRLQGGLAKLEESDFDIVLLDYSLPDSDGWETFARTREQSPHVPIILLTGLRDEALGIKAVHEGAQDYLVKGRTDSDQLVRAIRYAIERKRSEESLKRYRDHLEELVQERTEELAKANEELRREASERKQAEEELLRLAAAVHQASESIIITDTEGRIEYVNPSCERLSGYSREEMLGRNVEMLSSGKRDPTYHAGIWQTIAGGRAWQGHMTNRKKDGTLYEEEAVISPVLDADGSIVNYVAVKRDVTQEVALEDQLRQSQKMEAIGRLAGRISHDFTNVLLVVMQSAELLKDKIPEGSSGAKYVQQISDAADRASKLTGQLLAFSHQQQIAMRVLDLNKIVSGVDAMLEHTIGKSVRVSTHAFPGPNLVRVDPSQMEQILVHLAVNAQDAMPEGGCLTIQTSRVSMDREEALQLGTDVDAASAKGGEYAVLSVSDTGMGMSDEVRGKCFEPFFTTKGTGETTGLGLSTAYGIVRRHGGYITVYTHPGWGSTFTVYLPSMNESDTGTAEPGAEDLRARDGETILLAEDEPLVRRILVNTLQELGYAVAEAENSRQALRLLSERDGRVQLLIADMVMSGMDGKTLADSATRAYPDLKVLFASGYPKAHLVEQGILTESDGMISKPFSRRQVATAVRRVLDGGSTDGETPT